MASTKSAKSLKGRKPLNPNAEHPRPQMYCDLHMHSTASDGTAAPGELAQLARDAGLEAIALTDHDTSAGVVDCAAACRRAKVAFVPGIEISADPQLGGGSSQRSGTLHLLGLFIDHKNAKLMTVQQRLAEARRQRNPQIIEKLNALGVRIDYQEALDEAGGEIVGRPHIGQVLLNKGYVKSIQDAFSRYIGEGAAAYARKDRLSGAEAIEAIHDAGGLAILAHPVQLRLDRPEKLAYYVARLKNAGLDGIETRHSDHVAADVEYFEQLAANLELLRAGGSDYHGSRKSIELGSQRVPVEVYHQLKEAWERRG